MEISTAKKIMGYNFIGPEELTKIKCDLDLCLSANIPAIDFKEEELEKVKDTHLLVLCVSSFSDGTPINIENIKTVIGNRKSAPFFYNQDWYLKERFITLQLQLKWSLVSKSLYSESRGMSPSDVNSKYKLFSAVELVYIFFVYYFYSNGEKLWNNDYVWCSDEDDKGDQIYVGRYTDASGLNSDGFEIHRHLKIKNNYGCI